MNSFSCNMQKYSMSDVKGLEIETERNSENLKNKDIDYSKVNLNYDLSSPKVNMYQDIKERVEELKNSGSRVQKNSVVCAGFVFTLPENISEEKDKKYFKKCTEFLSENFGEKNIISAKVHKDESRPHLHVYLVPENLETGKLQARKSLDRNFLNKLHQELPKQLNELGFDVERGSSKGKEYIKDIHEFKEIQNKKNELQLDLIKEKEQLKKLEDKLKMYKRNNATGLNNIKNKLSKIPLTNNYVISEEQLNTLIKTGLSTVKDIETANKLIKGYNEMARENKEMRSQVEPLQMEVSYLKNRIKDKDKEIDTVKSDLNDEIRALNKKLGVLDYLDSKSLLELDLRRNIDELNNTRGYQSKIDKLKAIKEIKEKLGMSTDDADNAMLELRKARSRSMDLER